MKEPPTPDEMLRIKRKYEQTAPNCLIREARESQMSDIVQRLRATLTADTPARYPDIVSAAADEIERLRINGAELIEVMAVQKPWRDHLWARAALLVAAHVIRRGRHLSGAEKLNNLAAALEEDGGEEGRRAADAIRATFVR